jgi:putative metallohydrolase (TIGR04338 family)
MSEPAVPRPRDSQRARLYRAEDEVSPGCRLPTVEALQAYVSELATTEWFTIRWGERTFEVRPGYGHRRATADRNGVLQMPRWSRTQLIVLHEMAHCLTPVCFAAHGPEYAGVFLSLIRRGLTPASAQALEDAFIRHRVRWTMAAVPRPSPTFHRIREGAFDLT